MTIVTFGTLEWRFHLAFEIILDGSAIGQEAPDPGESLFPPLGYRGRFAGTTGRRIDDRIVASDWLGWTGSGSPPGWRLRDASSRGSSRSLVRSHGGAQPERRLE
jgi:hypothetical protein